MTSDSCSDSVSFPDSPIDSWIPTLSWLISGPWCYSCIIVDDASNYPILYNHCDRMNYHTLSAETIYVCNNHLARPFTSHHQWQMIPVRDCILLKDPHIVSPLPLVGSFSPWGDPTHTEKSPSQSSHLERSMRRIAYDWSERVALKLTYESSKIENG